MLNRTNLLGTVSAGVLAVATMIAWSPAAHATAYGYSTVKVTNLTATFLSGTTGLGIGFIAPFDFNADTGATLTGFPAAGFADTEDFPFSTDIAGGPINIGATGGPVNPLQAFVSDSVLAGPNPGQNSFGQVGDAGPSYARADHNLTDTLINTSGGGVGGVGGFGGDWQSVAETAVVGAVTGSGAAGNNQTWDFGTTAITAGTVVTIEFDLDALIVVSTDSVGEAGTGDLSFIFTMQRAGGPNRSRSFGLDLSQLSPGTSSVDELGLDPVGFTVADNGDGTAHIVVSIPGTGPVLIAGDYQFKITSRTNATANSLVVPEPAVLALLGAGFLGVGALTRRRRRVV